MKKLSEITLIDLVPNFLKSVTEVKNISSTFQKRFNTLLSSTDKFQRMKKIWSGELTSDEIELLMWEKHVDYYATDLTDEQKIELIKYSSISHLTKGTPATLNQMLSIIFEDYQIEEWFDYDGIPGTFRLVTSKSQPNINLLEKINKTVDAYKNTKSLFEGLMIQINFDVQDYCAIAEYDISYETITIE